ncbi:hypothetical protein [Micropruina sp.]|uniref:hypothetical protein n=1 Tax=Micropruina sp. TaxID=2737536 RepID=UPI0039E493C3
MITVLPGSGTADAAVPTVLEPTPKTVTADALPTVQINGVVWTQVMIGNVVYAGGEFTAARPAGAAAGTEETTRINLLAYDITTGALVTTFAPDAFNGPIRALAVSTDKKTLYVGGGFTQVGESVRSRFAALNSTTGALESQNPSFTGTINALAVNSTTVYAGGTFSAVNGKARSRLAAVKASTGKLTRWKAKADAQVYALLLTSKNKLLIVGGMFSKLNSTAASGSGAVSPKTGKTKTWKVNKVVKNGGKASAILSLATDGSTVYGTGYTYGTGNFEGVYAASSTTGAVRWLQDCHGDTYSVAPIGDIVYSVGHAHYCSNIGGFPDTSDTSKGRTAWYRALAVTKKAAGTVAKNGQTSSKAYTNFEGKPAPALYNWFPNLSAGTYTGMSQAAWSIVGNGTYISLGGEFPKVNGTAQQGLVRMAISAVAPNEVGPTGTSASLALAAEQESGGTVAVSWDQLWDRDDLALTYELSRNGVVIDKRTVSVPFWQRGTMSFPDPYAFSGSTSTAIYQVTVTDPHGNAVTSSKVSVEKLSSSDPDPSPTPEPSLEPTLEPSVEPSAETSTEPG